MELTFASIMEVIVTPITVIIGLLGNALSICVLSKKEIQLRSSFTRILIALSIFDITFISSSAALFSFRAISDYYRDHIYPWTVPVLLPVAQMSLTASVYTTVVTCFDRYIAICRPALLGCCGRSEDTTSWCLIIGTAVFSIIYNFSRFFEFRVRWVNEEVPYSNSTGQFLFYPPENLTSLSTFYDVNTNTSNIIMVNRTVAMVEQTDLRSDIRYIQYYIMVTNFIFMGVIPSVIMIIFNVLVVKAVDEANQRRARMTRRQQRNITVTSMLVTVVVVFLVCHSVKLFINGYEVYEMVKKNVEESNAANEEPPRLTMNATESPENYETNNATSWPLWVDYMTIVSHWLLILNSSCNIAIYLHKDPKFKAVLKEMFLSKLSPRLRIVVENSIGGPDQELAEMNGRRMPQNRRHSMNGTTWAEEKSPIVQHQPLIHHGASPQPLNVEAHLKNGTASSSKQLHVPVMTGCTNAISVSIETTEKPNHQADAIKEPLCQNGSDHP